MVHVVMNSHSTQPKEGIKESHWDLLLGEKVASLSAEMKLGPKEQFLDSDKFCIRGRHISPEFVHTFNRAASFLTATKLLQRYLFIALFPLFSPILCIFASLLSFEIEIYFFAYTVLVGDIDIYSGGNCIAFNGSFYSVGCRSTRRMYSS